MFVAEAPGQSEDEMGIPFVGKSGKLLDKMLVTCFGLSRSDVYVCNVVKCRPPQNREPKPEEITACFGYLQSQIMLVDPKVIVTLGRVATQNLLDTKISITKARGKIMLYNDIPVVPTTHPSYWLRNPPDRIEVANDMETVKNLMRKQNETSH